MKLTDEAKGKISSIDKEIEALIEAKKGIREKEENDFFDSCIQSWLNKGTIFRCLRMAGSDVYDIGYSYISMENAPKKVKKTFKKYQKMSAKFQNAISDLEDFYMRGDHAVIIDNMILKSSKEKRAKTALIKMFRRAERESK